jgi:hypothetical protein
LIHFSVALKGEEKMDSATIRIVAGVLAVVLVVILIQRRRHRMR